MNIIAQLKDRNGNIKGTGFLISNNFLITCTHVINEIIDITNEKETDNININLPFLDNTETIGKVVKYFPAKDNALNSDIEDLSLLKLSKEIETNIYPLISDYSGKFKTYGFGSYEGKWISLHPLGLRTNGWVQLKNEEKILNGYSGSPVFSENEEFIIGIIVARENEYESSLIPSSKIYKAFSDYIDKSFKNSSFYNYLHEFNQTYRTIRFINYDYFQSINLFQNKNFYKFTQPHWHDILLNHDVKRDIQDQILTSILSEETSSLILIKSPSGEGKSTLLKRLVYETYQKQHKCYFIDASKIEQSELNKLLKSKNFIYNKAILFIDNVFRQNTLFTILENEFLKNIKIVGTTQSREYKQYKDILVTEYLEPKEFHLTFLSLNEKKSIINKLNKENIDYQNNFLENKNEWMSEFIVRITPENNYNNYISKLMKELSLNEKQDILSSIIKYTALFYSYGLELSIEDLLCILTEDSNISIENIELQRLILEELYAELMIEEGKLVYKHELFATYIKNYFFLQSNINEIVFVLKLFKIIDVNSSILQLIKNLLVNIFQLSEKTIDISINENIMSKLNLGEVKLIYNKKSKFSKNDYSILYQRINQLKEHNQYETARKSYYFNKIYLKFLLDKYKNLDTVFEKFTSPRRSDILSREDIYEKIKKNNLLDVGELSQLYEYDLHILSNVPKANAINSFISLSYIIGKEKRANFILENTFQKTERGLYQLLKLYLDRDEFQKVIKIIEQNFQISSYKKNNYLYARAKLIKEKDIIKNLSNYHEEAIRYEYKYLNESKSIKIFIKNDNIAETLWKLALLSRKRKGTSFIFQNNSPYMSYINYIIDNSYNSKIINLLEVSIPAIYYIIENLSKYIGSINHAFYYIKLQNKILNIHLYPRGKIQSLLRKTTLNFFNFSKKIEFNNLKKMNYFLSILVANKDILSKKYITDIINIFLQNHQQTHENKILYNQFMYLISLLYQDYNTAKIFLNKFDLNEQFTHMNFGNYYFHYQQDYNKAIEYYKESYSRSSEKKYKISAIICLLNSKKKLKTIDNEYIKYLDILLSIEHWNYLGKEYYRELHFNVQQDLAPDR